ncbi:unnamed protein product [Microthlaspi erraticum]|uniref:Uncharacterized protein n=1 Tax=Microthlaspi erraticum TaxID=1685480 RepID=A0A6D2L5G3_9BRAS|nr:unnamed protein product [Microthlaspi erraticum]
MARRFTFVFLLIAFALAGGSYAADSSSPSPPTTTSNTTVKSPPATPAEKNSTDAKDYSDYDVPLDLAPEGVEVVEDYAPIDVKGVDSLAEPEEELSKIENKPTNAASSFYSSFSLALIVASNLFLF